MVYIFWSLLNIVVFLFLAYLFFRLVKPIQERYGTITALILVFVLLTAVYGHDDDKSTLSNEKWNFYSDTGKIYRNNFVTQAIHNNPLFTVNIGASYILASKEANPLPVQGFSYIIGALSGVSWRTNAMTLNSQAHAISYEVNGNMEWSLLNMVIYTKAKTFKGSIAIQ